MLNWAFSSGEHNSNSIKEETSKTQIIISDNQNEADQDQFGIFKAKGIENCVRVVIGEMFGLFRIFFIAFRNVTSIGLWILIWRIRMY